MKALANLLLAASLTAGALASATAYLAPLHLPDRELVGLTLAAEAGAVRLPGGQMKPLAGKGKTLSPGLLAALRSAGARYAHVKEFSPARWPGRWVFLAALAGMVGAALLARGGRAPGPETPRRGTGAPEAALAEVRAAVGDLLRDLPALPDEGARLRAVVAAVGEVQKTSMAAFVEGRGVLLDRLGLRAFAELMGRYAAAERLINRAWSAATDGAYEEARACLEEAGPALEEVARSLSARGASSASASGGERS